MRAGAAAAVVILAICLSAGLLVYAPFGPAISARGAAAGLLGAKKQLGVRVMTTLERGSRGAVLKR